MRRLAVALLFLALVAAPLAADAQHAGKVYRIGCLTPFPLPAAPATVEVVRWGDWGQACVMAFSYRDPRTSELVTVEQAVRVGVGRSSAWTPRRGQAKILCWGLLRSGLLRHPLFVGWTSTG